jgi:hypothetical protein
MTALTTATISEQTRVSFRAAIASGAVTWSQKLPRPPLVDLATIAEIGSRTMTLR